MKNLSFAIFLFILSTSTGCFTHSNKSTNVVKIERNNLVSRENEDIIRENDAEMRTEQEPGYGKQWFEKHKNEQGIIPQGLPEKWYAHDLQRFQTAQPEGVSPIATVENLATTTQQGGRTRALLVDKRDANIMCAGNISGGLWRTTDGGQSWKALNDAASNLSVSCIAQNPLRPTEIYYGTGESRPAYAQLTGAGVFKSTDGGLTFNKLIATEGNSDMRFCNYMAHSLTDSNTLYVGTSSGVYITTNAGATFTKIASLIGSNNGIISHQNGKTLATVQGVTTNSGIFLAQTGSTNFVKQTNPLFPTASVSRILIANCKAFPNVVYALFCNSSFTLEANLGLFKSSDFGITWNKMSDSSNTSARIGTDYSAYCQVLGVHPTDTNKVVIGALFVKKSLDGGVTYQSFSSGHADNHTYENIGTGNDFLMGNDGGIYKTTWDGTIATRNMNNAYTTLHFYAGNYAPSGKLAVGGTQDNGTWQYFNTTANTVFGGDGGYAHVSLQDSLLAYYATQSGNVYRTMGFANNVGGTVTITPTAAVNEGVDFINQYEINYADGKQLFYRTNKGLWRTVDKGTNWEKMNVADITNIQAIGVTAELNPSVYIGGANCFYRADSAATKRVRDTILRDLSASVPPPIRGYAWGTISIHPSVSTTLLVGITTLSPEPLAWRVNNAKSVTPIWTNISGDLPSSVPIYQIQAHPDKPDSILFAATGFGLYFSTNAGITWEKESRVPNVAIFEMKLRKKDRTLWVFTHGRGVWQVQLNNYGSPISAINELLAEINVKIFPNPTANILTIQADTPLSILQVFDVNGREIWLNQPQNTFTLDVSTFVNGIYFIKIYDNKGRFVIRKFIKKA